MRAAWSRIADAEDSLDHCSKQNIAKVESIEWGDYEEVFAMLDKCQASRRNVKVRYTLRRRKIEFSRHHVSALQPYQCNSFRSAAQLVLQHVTLDSTSLLTLPDASILAISSALQERY